MSWSLNLIQSLDLCLEVVVIEGLSERGLEFVIVPGLRDQPEDLALVDGFDRDRHVRVAGHHHADDVVVSVAHRGQEIDAAHVGHALIGNDDLRLVSFDQLERFRGPAGRDHFDRLASEQSLQGLQDIDFVIDKENAVFLHRGPRAIRSQACRIGAPRSGWTFRSNQ